MARIQLKGPDNDQALPNTRDDTTEHGWSFKRIIDAINTMMAEIYAGGIGGSGLGLEDGSSAKLSELDAASALDGTELAYVVQGSDSVKTTTQDIADLALSGSSSVNANVVTWLTTPSSANLRGALTDETGTGAAVFANTPTLVTPVLGAATGTSLTLAAGSSAAASLILGATTDGWYASGTGQFTWTSGGVPSFRFVASIFGLSSDASIRWSAGDVTAVGTDTGLARIDVNVLGVTNGSSGGGALRFVEMTAPSAPAANTVVLYAEDNGSGKTRLMARFPTGAAQQVAIEP